MEALEIGQKSYPENDRLTKFTHEQIQSLSLPENLKKRAIHISQEQKEYQLSAMDWQQDWSLASLVNYWRNLMIVLP